MCLGTLLLLTILLGGRLVVGGTVVGQDSATQFYPWYSYLGERLRSFDVPVWSPFQFAGAPFAADPQSGWTYLPAMILFTVLPFALAASAYILTHLALAGFATYALARVLRMNPLGALVAATAYEFSGLMAGRSVCCPAQIQVATWMPVLLLGAEVALRRAHFSSRVRWWGLAGLALSQILASWLGQVSYYALMVLAAYIAYRTLVDPPRATSGLRLRIGAFLVNGIAIVAIGFGLAAAGVIPRLEYNALSNVAGGVYDGDQSYAAVVGGWAADGAGLRDLSRSLYYPGGAALTLAVMAIGLAGRRRGAPFFLFVSGAAMLLASPKETPIHLLLYRLLPRFEELHSHWPERVAIVAYLAPAMLAGATVDALPGALRNRRRFGAALAIPAAIMAVAAFQWKPGLAVPWPALVTAASVIILVGVSSQVRFPLLSRAIPVALLAIVALDLATAGPRIMSAAPYGGFHRLDLEAYDEPSGAVQFLFEQQSTEPGRFFGYNPDLAAHLNGREVLYRNQFADPESVALIVNNRATLFGLQDIQGYNPVQFQQFVDVMTAINGQTQEYHDANVFPAGLDSPLLDLLNVRYVVIPAVVPPDRPEIATLLVKYPVVYVDADVQIVERTSALPRAWLVHATQQAEPDNALALLASGAIDPREVALIEGQPLTLERPSDRSFDRVRILDDEPERIRLRVSTPADGLLVLSEVQYPGWKVSVDGKPAQAIDVDYLLRGVAVRAGVHDIEWRYESRSSTLGLAVTLTTVSGLGLIGFAPLRKRRSVIATDRRPALAPAIRSV